MSKHVREFVVKESLSHLKAGGTERWRANYFAVSGGEALYDNQYHDPFFVDKHSRQWDERVRPSDARIAEFVDFLHGLTSVSGVSIILNNISFKVDGEAAQNWGDFVPMVREPITTLINALHPGYDQVVFRQPRS